MKKIKNFKLLDKIENKPFDGGELNIFDQQNCMFEDEEENTPWDGGLGIVEDQQDCMWGPLERERRRKRQDLEEIAIEEALNSGVCYCCQTQFLYCSICDTKYCCCEGCCVCPYDTE